MQGLTRTTTLSLTLFSTPLWADVHHVAPGQSIQAAVDAAADGDVIRLGPGLHVESVETVLRELKFEGAGEQSTIWQAAPSGGCLSLVGGEVHVDGLTMTKGEGFGSITTVGGAISTLYAVLTVTDCNFDDNEASSGGAINLNQSDAVILDSRFENNRSLSAGFHGGSVIKASSSQLLIDRSRFINNGGNTNFDAQGVLKLVNTTLELNNSVFRGNIVEYGSIAALSNSDAVVTHTTCLDNIAYTSGSIFWANNQSTVDLAYSVVQNNTGSMFDEPFRFFDGATFASAGNVSDVILPSAGFGDQWSLTNDFPTVVNFTGDYDAPMVSGYNAVEDFPLEAFTTTSLDTSVDLHLNGRTSPTLAGAVSGQDTQHECPADMVADGQVNMDDLLLVLQTWGNCDGACPGDANQDGFTDWLDLLSVITAWGACP